ncbi:MAG: DUF917 domain-containing protein [Armatimonadota bacterium]|nr:DUF917 domain-containing protein [Armatimonadota bacterium]MDR7404018.1 DUF917 domain-containing protein [Armatimonadota bacterium]MDR7574187.1 DUF917 domain-containing protein [Armatimonadota bacterium]
MPRHRVRTTVEAEDFLRGLTLLGTGGGGRPDKGREYLLPHVTEGPDIEWVDVSEVSDDTWVCTTFGMGSIAPTPVLSAQERAALGYGEVTVPRPMAEAVSDLAEATGRAIGAIIPFELGAGNTAGPIDAAARLGLLVVDADLAGRAVPELTQTTAALAGVPLCPVAICDSWGNRLMLREVHSLAVAERIGKMISLVTRLPDPRLTCAYAGYLMQGADLRRVAVAGTLTRALTVGRVIREAREAGRDPLTAAAAALGGQVLFTGVVTSHPWESRDGYMIGETHLNGTRAHRGQRLRIWYKNENHIAWLDGQPCATSPDLIMVADAASGEPYTNTDLSVGVEVGVLVALAPPVFRTPAGLAALGPGHFGFDIPYIPSDVGHMTRP